MKTQITLNTALQNLPNELHFTTARSGGKGGQNVNKVETKVLLTWNPAESDLFDDEQKSIIMKALLANTNKEGLVHLACETYRTQLENKNAVVRRLQQKISTALTPKKKRHKTHIPRAVKEQRLESKKQHSSLKQLRKKVSL
ncbi:MAG: aminoacyl-tRNA hydrolase [Chitinophagaceae bacterium]|nr:aminoacyl-tRNA hydrolase [Chitinophagaceae bacterium]